MAFGRTELNLRQFSVSRSPGGKTVCREYRRIGTMKMIGTIVGIIELWLQVCFRYDDTKGRNKQDLDDERRHQELLQAIRVENRHPELHFIHAVIGTVCVIILVFVAAYSIANGTVSPQRRDNPSTVTVPDNLMTPDFFVGLTLTQPNEFSIRFDSPTSALAELKGFTTLTWRLMGQDSLCFIDASAPDEEVCHRFAIEGLILIFSEDVFQRPDDANLLHKLASAKLDISKN